MDGRELVAGYFDNTLTEAQAEELAAWIAESQEHARFFAEWSVLEDQVAEQFGVAEVLRAEQQSLGNTAMHLAGRDAAGKGRAAVPWLLMAAAVVVLATVAVVWGGWSRPSATPPVVDTPPAQDGLVPQPVAMLVGQRDAVWDMSSSGDELQPLPGVRFSQGNHHLLQGVAHLRTEGGTDLFIEGPARFDLQDEQTLRLVSGRVYGDATASAKAFSVKSARLDLDACSRTFGVYSGVDTVMCQVYSGTADVLTRNASGDVEHVSRLMPNQSLTVDADGRVRLGRLDASALVRTFEASELGVGRSYVQAVHDSGPTDYWRFEQVEGGDLFNEVPGRPSLRIQSVGGGLNLSDDVQNRYLHRTDITGEFLVSTQKVTVNSDRYSVECWVRNDYADAWTTLFAFQVFPVDQTELEFGLIQLEMLPAVEGDADAGHRFMLTHADRAGPFPDELLSPADRDASTWHHIVLVRDGKRIELFRDGQPWAAGRAQRPGSTMDAVLVIGRNGITPGGNYRLFRGSLDEVALYDRALTATEIRSHYQAMDRPPADEGGQ